MELLWLYILLGAVLKLSSGIAYNKKEVSTSSFACYTDTFTKDTAKTKAVKLYLPQTSLKVICHLYNINEEDTKENRRKNLLLYTSAGLAPSIQIFNSTYSNVFFFEMTLGKGDEEVDSWFIDIPRERITYNTDIAPVEEWFVKFNMHHGLGMFTTEGTLLDIKREPILQWLHKLGTYVNINKTMSEITDLSITKSPCASDVAIIGVIYRKKDTGIVIGVTEDGFMNRDVIWHNLTDNICVLMDYDCSGLALVDILLINTRLIILTTLGLFVSEDLRYPSEHKLKFNKPALCGFEMDDYYEAKIWYNKQCLANREDYEVDYVSLSFNKDKTLSQESTCFYSNDSFTKWHSCLPHKPLAEKHISRRVISFVVDYEQNTGIALLSQKDKKLVSVHKLTDGALNKKTKFPTFTFPSDSFVPTGFLFHPGSHFLYVYGNQMWGSFDGGNTFIPLIILLNETIIRADSCVYTQGIVFVTDKANIYYTKAGIVAYTWLITMPLGVFDMYFDHLGILSHISFNSTSEDGLSVSVMDMNSLMQETDLGFDGPLSPHYVTEEQMLFFHHGPPNTIPTFSNLQSGKRIDYEPGGSGVINTVFTRMNPAGVVSSVLVDVLENFPVESITDSPCTANTLTILPPKPNSTSYQLQLATAGTNVFKASDVEKTVVIPGTSSFFITKVLDDLNALGTITLPEKMLLNYSFPPDEWFLYDFGTTNGRKWKIVVDTCRYVIQQFDDLPLHAIKYLDLGQKLHFSFRVTPVNTAFLVFHQYLMRVLVGRPFLLDMTTEDYWDDNHSYVFSIIVQSKFFEQGKTTLAVILPFASLLCDVACIVLTLKSSCSYLKAMHYVLPYELSPSDWLSPENTAEYSNSEIRKYLKVLPVNYRPPSEMGIAVPLTDNFYNADPSKPRMRDYFEGSKTSGKYKQCANKSSRAECKCADNMKLSFSVAFSDCKEKALRMKFPVEKLPLYFMVEDEGYFFNLTSPYFVTIKEVNNRTNWKISGTNETLSLTKLRMHLESKVKTKLYNPDGLTISITGSELFHFRVSTIPGVSFCNLFDEFQIYIDDSPLAFPGQYLISTIVAVSIGGILFTAFLLHIYEIQIVNFFKRNKNRNKVESKTSIVTASETSIESNES
ncbi:cation channel sperm-associated protein subunit beta isoform X1 [Crotalus tigris]|uniref:cation channel sperm-associated protein subunit beta isoform X1 n=1 Tax=Crotalus tigris TaxID=88082 RepID=UPI00192FA668|nr:cation channel sperm-associated protein subunit beta isoform X1 [Crotalus tigris]